MLFGRFIFRRAGAALLITCGLALGGRALAIGIFPTTRPTAAVPHFQETPIGTTDEEKLSFAVSPDGRHIAYATHRGDSLAVIVDGKQQAIQDGIGPNSLIFSPDSRHFAYTAQKGDGWIVVKDGTPSRIYDVAGGTLVFSPDSRRFACCVGIGKSQYVVCDGKQSPAYDDISTGVFNPDSKHAMGAVLDQGGQRVWVDGHLSPPYGTIVNASPRFDEHDRLEFLADRTGILYRVKFDAR